MDQFPGLAGEIALLYDQFAGISCSLYHFTGCQPALPVGGLEEYKTGPLAFCGALSLGCRYHMYLGITSPDSYLGNASLALPFYRDFINGWFSRYNHILIPLIACGQLLIAIGMLLKGWWVRWACIGTIIFLLSIAPLMVGSAFPFSITVSAAAFIILRKDNNGYLWRKRLSPKKSFANETQ
jgi:hypothetical protein